MLRVALSIDPLLSVPMVAAMMRAGGVTILLLISGCATKSVLMPIKYDYVDVSAKRQIEIAYRNHTGVAMCLPPEHWPNQAGKINQASDILSLVVGQERFPIESSNTGYCPQGCAVHVAPGEQVSSSIPYADFRLPERLTDAPKTLDFSPKAFVCKAK